MLMEKMSAEELRKEIYTNEDGERVLDLRNKGLSKVPEAVTDLTELENLTCQIFIWKNYQQVLTS